jgi:hypothetical protein
MSWGYTPMDWTPSEMRMLGATRGARAPEDEVKKHKTKWIYVDTM